MAHATHHTAHAGPETARKQPFHLVDPSPWPLLTSAAAGVTALGAALFMHGKGWGIVAGGFAALLLMMVLWWRDVIREAVVQKAHSPEAKVGFRYGMALFIASEVMFFAAFFWAFFNASLYPTEATGGMWPPKGIHTVEAFELPLMMTLILLLSGTTVTWAHHAILDGNRRDAVKALAITVFLGVFFTFFQAYEYHHAAFGFRQGIYPSTFFMATGFHGFHVLVGTIFLAVTLFRTQKGHFTPQSHFGFEAAAWYWHFVDAVWLFLFVAIYWWGS
ncbi:MAG: cytochrome c oxidase subunit 3 [Pseudomonadota bacterium]|nr:cytochrome c oxidase subunit 3 [Pseudomonadota bacterium]